MRVVQRMELFDYARVRARASARGHAHVRPCAHVDEGCDVPTGGGTLLSSVRVRAYVRACMCARACANNNNNF